MSLNRLPHLAYIGMVTFAVAIYPYSSMAQPKMAEEILLFQRHEVDYNSPVGIPVGGFLLTPGLGYNAIYDDNIFLKKDNQEKDFISIFKPSLALQSNWGRHEVYMGLQAAKTKYKWNSQKDALDFGGIVSGTYDITYGTYIDGFIRQDRRNLNRGSEEDIDGSIPIEYDSWASRIGFSRALSYIQTKVAVFHDNTKREEDVATAIPGDFLERDRNGLEGTLTYEYFPKNNLFVTASHTNIDYDLVGGTGRIVNKSDLKYGLNFNYSEIYSGSLYFGHLETDYNHLPQSISDPYVGLTLNWAPSQLTSVSFASGRSYMDGSISAEERVMVDVTRLNISHQFTNFVRGNLVGSVADNVYETLSGSVLRENTVYSIGAGAEYRVSDHLGFRVNYDYKTRSSDNMNEEYKNNRVMFSLSYMH